MVASVHGGQSILILVGHKLNNLALPYLFLRETTEALLWEKTVFLWVGASGRVVVTVTCCFGGEKKNECDIVIHGAIAQ